jgi:hypothetical protein
MTVGISTSNIARAAARPDWPAPTTITGALLTVSPAISCLSSRTNAKGPGMWPSPPSPSISSSPPGSNPRGNKARSSRDLPPSHRWSSIRCQTHRPSSILPACVSRGHRRGVLPSGAPPLGEEEAERLASALGVLADPTRLRLMSLIGQPDGACVCEPDRTGRTLTAHGQPPPEGVDGRRAPRP